MTMAAVWTVMVAASILCAAATGRAEAVSVAAMEGAKTAVELCTSISGAVCLWSGVMEVMNSCGLSDALATMLRPIIRRIFPASASDRETMNALCANVSANVLGLGNAATPLGIKAAAAMKRLGGQTAEEISRLVVMNTASVQLLPTTIAAVRAAEGAQSAFDILPAVWISSLGSVAAGLICERLMSKRARK